MTETPDVFRVPVGVRVRRHDDSDRLPGPGWAVVLCGDGPLYLTVAVFRRAEFAVGFASQLAGLNGWPLDTGGTQADQARPAGRHPAETDDEAAYYQATTGE